jgi:hypothetical protein
VPQTQPGAWLAAGPIAANVFVIEYIGELLRRPLDDVREKVL